MSLPRRYWDSTVFLAWLLPEPDRQPVCREVLKAAEDGQLQIVTSSITLTEVIKLPGRERLEKDQEQLIRRFFMNEYIIIQSVTRFVAEEARNLIWSYARLHPKDSIHVATALFIKEPVLDTFDEKDLIQLDGKLENPPLKIGNPSLQQPGLPFVSSDEEEGKTD